MMKDSLRLLRSAKMIRWLLCPHHVVLVEGTHWNQEDLCSCFLFSIWTTPWFHVALVDKEGRCYSWRCLLPLTDFFFPFLSHTQTVGLQIYFLLSYLVSEPLIGNWKSPDLYMHTPIPWVFTVMSFITPPPAPEFKMKHLKFDQGCVLMSAWIIHVPCFLKWFLPFCLPPEKNRLTAFYRLFSLHTPIFPLSHLLLFTHQIPCKTPAFNSGSRINKTACGMKHTYIQVVCMHIWIFP